MKNIIIAFRFFVAATLLTGLLYPLFVTAIGQTFFAAASNGQLELIGQKFDRAEYFWPRPSAVDYNPLPSGGSNLSATDKTLSRLVAERKQRLLAADPGASKEAVPADLLYASGSGLDPEISRAAAEFQAARVARARHLTRERVLTLIAEAQESFGAPRVNVLKLNQLLDATSFKE